MVSRNQGSFRRRHPSCLCPKHPHARSEPWHTHLGPCSYGLRLEAQGVSRALVLRCAGGKVSKGLGEPGTVRVGGPERLGSSWRGLPLGLSFLLLTVRCPLRLGPLMQPYLLLRSGSCDLSPLTVPLPPPAGRADQRPGDQQHRVHQHVRPGDAAEAAGLRPAGLHPEPLQHLRWDHRGHQVGPCLPPSWSPSSTQATGCWEALMSGKHPPTHPRTECQSGRGAAGSAFWQAA